MTVTLLITTIVTTMTKQRRLKHRSAGICVADDAKYFENNASEKGVRFKRRTGWAPFGNYCTNSSQYPTDVRVLAFDEASRRASSDIDVLVAFLRNCKFTNSRRGLSDDFHVAESETL